MPRSRPGPGRYNWCGTNSDPDGKMTVSDQPASIPTPGPGAGKIFDLPGMPGHWPCRAPSEARQLAVAPRVAESTACDRRGGRAGKGTLLSC